MYVEYLSDYLVGGSEVACSPMDSPGASLFAAPQFACFGKDMEMGQLVSVQLSGKEQVCPCETEQEAVSLKAGVQRPASLWLCKQCVWAITLPGFLPIKSYPGPAPAGLGCLVFPTGCSPRRSVRV